MSAVQAVFHDDSIWRAASGHCVCPTHHSRELALFWRPPFPHTWVPLYV